jgi:hypothetical protein
MAYTINQGFQDDRSLDRLQRGLLVGLPALALILGLGAIRQHQSVNNPAGENAKLIPIVSSLSNGKDNSSNDQSNNSSTGFGSTNDSAASNTSLSALGSSGTSTGSGSSSTVIGGMGGGPVGGSGGVLPLNESLYIPPVDVQTGGKSVVNTSGTTVNVN